MNTQDNSPLHEGIFYLDEDSAYQSISEYALTDVEVVKDEQFAVPVYKVVKI